MLATYNLDKLRKVTPPEFIEDVCRAGLVSGNYVAVEVEKLRSIMAHHRIDEGPKPPKPQPQPRVRGMGDVVALIAKPIARLFDKLAKTNLKNCPGCAARQAALNWAMPFRPSSKRPVRPPHDTALT